MAVEHKRSAGATMAVTKSPTDIPGSDTEEVTPEGTSERAERCGSGERCFTSFVGGRVAAHLRKKKKTGKIPQGTYTQLQVLDQTFHRVSFLGQAQKGGLQQPIPEDAIWSPNSEK